MTEDQNRTLQDKFMLRLPDGMRDTIKQLSDENGRSMNSEIVALLQHAITNSPSVIAKLKRDIEALDDELNLMEGDLKDQSDIIKSREELFDIASSIVKENVETQKRHLLFVLDYFDRIPIELAIWAYNMVQIIEKGDPIDNKVLDPVIMKDEALKLMSRRREAHYKEAIRKIRALVRNEDDTPDEAVPE